MLKINPKIEKFVSELISESSNKFAALFEASERETVVNKLSLYADYVDKWSRTHNIVSKQLNFDDIADNILDSIYLSSEIIFECFYLGKDELIIDAGAGGGFPGIPLAIIFFRKQFHLVDNNRKKCSFLRSARALLDLKNVNVIQSDIALVTPAPIVITKAAFSPQHAHLLVSATTKNGQLLVWSTQKSSEALIHALNAAGMFLRKKQAYVLPSGKERCLLLLAKS